jgi:hypothetical protein
VFPPKAILSARLAVYGLVRIQLYKQTKMKAKAIKRQRLPFKIVSPGEGLMKKRKKKHYR